jgi:predicted ATP-grasp superfamily ATP-dependent carboligase
VATTVLLTDAEERATLAASRCLRAAGYRVALIAFAKPAPGHWSRSCAERLSLPSPVKDLDGFLGGLAAIVARRRYHVLLPGGDPALAAISRHRRMIDGRVLLGMPSEEAVERSLDKVELIDAARAAGLPCPQTIVCRGPAEAVRAAQALGCPVVVKPQRSVLGLGGAARQQSSRIAADAAEVARWAQAFGERCLVQRRAVGAIHSCSGVAAGGRLLAFATSRYARTFPVDGGNAAFARTIEPPPGLRERIGALVRLLGWQGIFEVELVREPDGALHVIDMNPRVFGSLSLVTTAGAPLPAIWCDWLLGRDPAPVVARAGVRYRWEDADARHLLWQLRRGRARAALAVARPHRHVVHAHFRLQDPAPLLARLLYMARSGLRRLWAGG